MARHHYRSRKFKFKLKNETIYSIFSFGMILVGLLLFLSFSRSGDTLTSFNDLLSGYFGIAAYLFPFVPILFGFLFLRMKKFFLSRPHVALGFLIIFAAFDSISQGGALGSYLFASLADVITSVGAYLVYLVGIFIGIIVLFDTSIDELVVFGKAVADVIERMFPASIVSFFKNKNEPLISNKPLTIKGQKDFDLETEPSAAPVVKKAPSLISDKLVSNAPTTDGMWEFPPLDLLSEESQKANRGDIKKIASTIEKTLESFGIGARVVEVNLGPAVTQYALELALGTKVAKITSLANDLALATEAPTGQIRIEAPIPGRNLVGIEIPNRSLEVVPLKTMLASDVMRKSKSKLTVSLGLDVSGNPVVADIAKMPHVLVAGTTGSGKSVLVNSFIATLLFRASPAEVKFIMVDPKRVELSVYNGIPHLMTPVIVEPEKILASLKWAMDEMDRRYKTFAERGVRNIDSYNELAGFQALPYIVIFIDELADLMIFAPVEVEDAIARLAQMARATGIHLVIATQRPSVDVITGLIKANIPARMAFNVSSMIDSRVILDSPGAEKLLGRGDMLYIPPDQARPTRIQGAFLSEKEVKKVVEFLKTKNPNVEYTEEVTSPMLVLKKNGAAGGSGGDGNDALFEEAIRVVCQFDRASASLLQRKLSIGYSRAARILDQLEAVGLVGHAEGSKPRDVLSRNAEEFINTLHGES